jgi:hypothetical protein
MISWIILFFMLSVCSVYILIVFVTLRLDQVNRKQEILSKAKTTLLQNEMIKQLKHLDENIVARICK